jgi:hypothetical protein
MATIEQLTYTEIGARLGVTAEAVRALVRRHHLPRLRGNDGKTLVAIDLDEVRHKPQPARSPRGYQPGVTETLAKLQVRIAELEAELAAERQRSAGHRADYKHERERADRMVGTQDRLVAELEILRGLRAAIQEAARPRTSWLGGWRWLLMAS